MPHRHERMIKQHSRSGEFHNLLNPFSHLRLIAVYCTVRAKCLFLHKRTHSASLCRIFIQSTAFITQFSTYAVRIMTHVMACAILHSVISVMVLPSIQRNHLPNYLLLPESLFLSLIIHISPRQMLIPRFLL